jgi:hypothetical protein
MPPETQPILPWMVKFAFWASVILTVFKIVELAVNIARTPRLDLRLTPDVFFRLTDFGETLFCNSVLLSWNGPIVIVETHPTLDKIDSPTKSFPFKVLQFGQKVKGAGPLPDHYFHSRSAISHLAESKPQQALYLCVQEKYEDKSRKALANFQKEVLEYKQEVLVKAAALPAEGKDTFQKEILGKVNQIVDKHLPLMMEVVQLEPGQYRLSLEVDYQNPKSRLVRRKRTIQSSIEFSIGTDVRDHFRVNLRQTLLVGATNLLLDQQTTITYPEYQPLQVRSV